MNVGLLGGWVAGRVCGASVRRQQTTQRIGQPGSSSTGVAQMKVASGQSVKEGERHSRVVDANRMPARTSPAGWMAAADARRQGQ